MQLPNDLLDSLSDRVLTDIERWWTSLTPEQRTDLCDVPETLPEDCISLPDLGDVDPTDEHLPIYEYLVNHELRTVSFVADAQQDNFHKFATTYLATLGSDYRHGEHGTVR